MLINKKNPALLSQYTIKKKYENTNYKMSPCQIFYILFTLTLMLKKILFFNTDIYIYNFWNILVN